MKPEFYIDENLRNVPKSRALLEEYVLQLKNNLKSITDPDRQAGLMGEIGVYLKRLGELDEAESFLIKALDLISKNDLDIRREIQQKIRLGHILQFKKEFDKSNQLFTEIIEVCGNVPEATVYLDFALQHSGKNLFDQARYDEALKAFEHAYELRKARQAPEDQLESTKIAIEKTRQLLQEKHGT